MQKFYNKDYFKKYGHKKGYISQKENPKYVKRLKELEFLTTKTKTKTDKKILDIGCAYGYFLDKAKNLNYQTFGIDISQHACKIAGKKHKVICLNVCRKKFPFPADFFDAVVLDNTLEHLTNIDIVLKEVDRILKRKGILLIEIPLRNRWATDKTHISYFDRIALEFILNNLNFIVLKIGEEGGKFRNITGIIKLIAKGNTLFNFVPQQTGSFLICYAQKK